MLCGAQGVFAQGAKELRYASSAPPNTVWEMQTVRFAEGRGRSERGKLKINAFLNSQLGSEQDTVQQVARGRIDMGGYSDDRRLAAGARARRCSTCRSCSRARSSRTACSTTT